MILTALQQQFRHYHNVSFSKLEFEQKAHVRKLVREGKAMLLKAQHRSDGLKLIYSTTYVYIL